MRKLFILIMLVGILAMSGTAIAEDYNWGSILQKRWSTTELQWDLYKMQTLKGTVVCGSGTVIDVTSNATIQLKVPFTIPRHFVKNELLIRNMNIGIIDPSKSVAINLNKNDEVTFCGRIIDISSSMSLWIEYQNVKKIK